MGYVFVSYSHKDVVYVEKLVRSLRREGFNVWVDMDLRHGTQWMQRLQTQLDECCAYLVVMTPSALASKMVQNELARANWKKKPVFPLWLGGEPWFTLQSVQFADVRGGVLPPESFYEQLAKVTKRGRRRTGTEDKSEDINLIERLQKINTSSGLEKAKFFVAKVSHDVGKGTKHAVKKAGETVDAISKSSVIKKVSSKIKRKTRSRKKK